MIKTCTSLNGDDRLKSAHRIALIVTLFLLVITGMRLAFIQYQKPAEQPAVIQGVLDLLASPIKENDIIALNGEWDFFPSRFLLPGDSEADEAERISIQVPGDWKNVFPPDDDSPFRYGTYRLRIVLQEPDRDYQLRIQRINYASAVYVNGQPAGQSGTPSSSAEAHRAQVLPYSVSLPPGEQSVEILIHASNHAGLGGIVEAISFGTENALEHRVLLSWILQIGLCIVFLIHALYAAMLFFFGVANKGLLYFSAQMLFAIFSVLVANDKLLYQWIDMPYEMTIKISHLTYIGVVFFIPLLLNQIYSGLVNSSVIRWFVGYCAVHAAFVLTAPSQWILSYTRLLSVTMLISVIVSGFIMMRAVGRRSDALSPLIGVTAIGTNIVWAITANSSSAQFMYYPFDLMIGVFCFAALWFKRFVGAVNETNRLADQLRLANRQKDDFLVNTSHELRNPLHGIINIAQSILDDTVHPVPDNHRQRLEIQVAVGRRLAMMLDDLVDVTRLQDSTIRLHITNVRLQAIVTSIAEMLRHQLEGKPIALRMDIPDDAPAVRADENRLTQVLFNLLHNAIKFTDEGHVAIRAIFSSGMASIRIEDTGIGMDEETQRRVFAPYEQGHSDRSKAVGGVGLGLSISKQLVGLHGSELTVESAPGQGTAFAFSLPLAESSELTEQSVSILVMHHSSIAPDAEARTEIAVDASKRARLLIVDDDSINLKILSDLIGSVRYEVTAVTSGAEAISLVEKGGFDLLISDVMMPQLSGYELTRTVRRQFSAFELPVLLLTARNRAEDIVAGFQAGANDYVVKPVNALEFKARVNALVELKSSIGERLHMEAAWLQAQMQPHFIFNTMNSIAALATMDIPKMQKLLEEFSNYLRMSFDFHNSDRLVSISRELALVRSYLYIEKERFEERLEVKWELDQGLDILLPPMSIQTLVENAVRHGLMSRSDGGTIEIRIRNATDHCEVCIRDNGVGMSEEKLAQLLETLLNDNKGVGLRNTDRRLKQLYGQGLQLRSSPSSGTEVVFRIPR